MKFYGQFNPPVDEVLYKYYFPRKFNGFFIECGAYDGVTESSCKFFEESMSWKGINIEASPRVFQRLAVNRQWARNINVALSDAHGTAIFSDIVSPNGFAEGNGSLKHAPEHVAYLKKNNCGFVGVEVPTTTYRELVIAEKVSEVDLMVLDVEGCELKVIDGMRGASVLPRVLCAEFSFVGLAQLEDALRPLGYFFDFKEEVNAFFSRR
jgi:FkbM family methyltransferase